MPYRVPWLEHDLGATAVSAVRGGMWLPFEEKYHRQESRPTGIRIFTKQWHPHISLNQSARPGSLTVAASHSDTLGAHEDFHPDE